MLDGVDACFSQSGLQIFDAIIGKAHKLGHAGRRAHGNFFEAQPRWELDFHPRAPGFNHFGLPSTQFTVAIRRSQQASRGFPPKKTTPREYRWRKVTVKLRLRPHAHQSQCRHIVLLRLSPGKFSQLLPQDLEDSSTILRLALAKCCQQTLWTELIIALKHFCEPIGIEEQPRSGVE